MTTNRQMEKSNRLIDFYFEKQIIEIFFLSSVRFEKKKKNAMSKSFEQKFTVRQAFYFSFSGNFSLSNQADGH